MTKIPDPVFPSDLEISKAVQAIHDHPTKVYIAVTGGASGLQHIIWSTAGASRTLLGSVMPYDQGDFADFIGKPLERYCSAEAAMELADAALHRARKLTASASQHVPVIGLGVTAALVTDRERKGKCRIFVTAIGDFPQSPSSVSLELTDDEARSWLRTTQGRLSDLLALNLLLEALGLKPLPIGFPETPSDTVSCPEPWTIVRFDGQAVPMSEISPTTHVLYPGSFNPLHFGHLAAANAIRAQLCKDVLFLIERDHPTKGSLSDAEIARRVEQFAWKGSVMVTAGVGLYIEKAKRFPGYGFVVGADTMERICNQDFYHGSFRAMNDAFDEFLSLGTGFYVFDRQADDGKRMRTIHDIVMPDTLRARCKRCAGQWNISSTQLREAAKTT